MRMSSLGLLLERQSEIALGVAEEVEVVLDLDLDLVEKLGYEQIETRNGRAQIAKASQIWSRC
jgi:hypothetical protein